VKDTRRIAVVGACPYPVPQGSQVYLHETARAYQRDGHDVRLVTYGYGVSDEAPDLPVHRCANLPLARRTQAGPSWAKPLLDALLVRTLKQVVQEHAIDEVDAHNYEGLLVALAAGKRPVMYHAHNAMCDELPYYFGGMKWAARLGAWLDRTFPKRADRVVVPHARLEEYLVECGCDPNRIEVVIPSIDPLPFQRPKRPATRPTVIYAGNLDRYQNLDFLLEAMAKVRETLPDAELIIATSAQRDLPGTTVVHTPDIETLAHVLAQNAVFACPRVSWSGFPIKLLNALAADLPIVCCQSAAHLPIQDGINARVVPDNDVEAFGAAVMKSLEDGSR